MRASEATWEGATSVTSGVLPVRRRRRRGVELAMLIFAVIVAMGAFAAVGYAHDGRFTLSTLSYGGGLAVLFLIAHVVVRRVAPYADPLLLPAVALLNGLGLVLIHRVDLGIADQARALGHTPPAGEAPSQLVWTAIALACFVIVLLVVRDHRTLQRYSYTCAALGLFLLILPAILPASISEINGARVWIRLAGFSIQPGEFAKLLLVVFFASYLVAKRDLLSLASRRVAGIDLPRGRDLGPVLVAWIASLAVLIRESDLGTSLLFFAIFVTMLYVATERTSWLLIGLLLFAGGAFLTNLFVAHVHERVFIWLHPFADPNNKGYQLVQSLFGFATGGIFGDGLGQGRPQSVPFSRTDFIAATIGEELGLIGLMAIIVLFLLVVERGLRAALSVRDPFGKLLAGGLAFALGIQVFVQVGGVMRLIPLTGLTLPFMSYGGSSLVSNYILIALLLRVSDAARRPPDERVPARRPAAAEPITEVVRP